MTRFYEIVFDWVVLLFAYAFSYLMHYEWTLDFQGMKILIFTAPYILILQYSMLSVFGVPKFISYYIGFKEAKKIIFALSTAAFTLFAVYIIASTLKQYFIHRIYVMIPISVIIIDSLIAFIGLTGIRVLRRMHNEKVVNITASFDRRIMAEKLKEKGIPTLLIGAGQAGIIVSKEIDHQPKLGIKVLGFIDDDEKKVGKTINDIKVLGTTSKLEKIINENKIKQAIITISAVSGDTIRNITNQCKKLGLSTKIMPGISDIVSGKVNLSRIRDVNIEDLLGRDPVRLEIDKIADIIEGRIVLISGAGGSIGSELCRQVVQYNPRTLILIDHSENSMFYIHGELTRNFPNVPLIPFIVNICDIQRIDQIFEEYKPNMVLHAAAHKHVPMMEWNPGEAIKNNVIGTKILANTADKYGTELFVMISTDKAVNPTSIMGASKRVAEIYIQAMSQASETRFVAVRFGNVLASAGSVIPTFNRQIKDGGPVTVTHPDMRRYFMTIPEASQLVLQAAAMGEGGEIFILDMGEPVKIVDLARDLIKLSGFEPEVDILIQFSGIRPGEKLFEELSVKGENAAKTRHPKVFIGKIKTNKLEDVKLWISKLETSAIEFDSDYVRKTLIEIIPEYCP
ncbi:MAG: polysaccharide biosynthesis protein [Planctomycetes bacterium]|nr:polysaccharide biosynthesis protein [Planctomycetota bacterium]